MARYLVVVLALLCVSCSENKDEALKVARDWARLAPYPTAAKLEVEILGGATSREFIVQVEASKEELDKWLEQSPGIQDAEIVEKGTRMLYKIKPKDAQFAELERLSDTLIQLRTYWS